MGGCSCSCQHKDEKKANPGSDRKGYICHQCNTYKDVAPEAPPPECCGKKMAEMD